MWWGGSDPSHIANWQFLTNLTNGRPDRWMLGSITRFQLEPSLLDLGYTNRRKMLKIQTLNSMTTLELGFLKFKNHLPLLDGTIVSAIEFWVRTKQNQYLLDRSTENLWGRLQCRMTYFFWTQSTLELVFSKFKKHLTLLDGTIVSCLIYTSDAADE